MNSENLHLPVSSKNLPCSSECLLDILNEGGQTFGGERIPFGWLLRSIFSKSPVVKEYFDLPSGLPEDVTNEIPLSRLYDSVEAIRVHFGHSHVNEMHFLLALFESETTAAQFAMRPLEEEYQFKHPRGSKGQELLFNAISSKALPISGEVRNMLTNTPFGAEAIIRRIRDYLGSEFYPYDNNSWERFKGQCLLGWKRTDDIFVLAPIHAFVAHGVGSLR